MTIYQDQNGNCTYEFTFNKVRHRGSCKTKNKQVATRIEAEMKRKLALGQVDLVDLKNNKKTTLFRDAAADYIERKTPSWKPETLGMHQLSYVKVDEYFGNMVLNSIDSDDIQRYQAYRKQQETRFKTPPSNRTINIELTLVRQVLIDARLWYKMREGTSLKMLKERHDVGQALQQEQVVRLLNACQTLRSRVVYPMAMLSIFTGIRSGELKRLKWQQIDFERQLLKVGKSKTAAGENREIFLDPLAIDLIKNWRTNFVALPHHYVFPNEMYARGKRISTNPEVPYWSFYNSWNKARKAAGVTCRWHDLRHTCASILASNGASKATLKAVLGWFSDKMLDVYIHSHRQEQQRAMSSVGDFFLATNLINSEPTKESIQ